MNKTYLLAVILSLGVAAPGFAKDATSSMPTTGSSANPDRTAIDVLPALHHANLVEIEMGDLAKSNGRSKAVREYGDMLVKHHKENEDKVQALADELAIELKDKDETLTEEDRQSMKTLKAMTGSKFDRAFALAMIKDHKMVIENLQAAKQTATGPVALLIDETLPVLRNHQSTAEQLSVQLQARK